MNRSGLVQARIKSAVGGVGAVLATPVGIHCQAQPHTTYAQQAALWIHLASTNLHGECHPPDGCICASLHSQVVVMSLW